MAICGFCPLSVAIDVFCVIAVFLPYIVLEAVSPRTTPIIKGFFCHDESLSLPYREETISDAVLIAVTVSSLLGTIILTELIHLASNKYSSKEREGYRIAGRTINSTIPLIYASIGLGVFGYGIAVSSTELIKYLMGSLRPHFFSVCQPNITSSECTNSLGQPQFITQYTCLGTDQKKIYQSRLSFFSGHASVAVFSMVYLACYIQLRWNWRVSGLLRPLVQVVLVILGILCGLSRIWDNMHHWWDVVVGILVGVIIAVWMMTRLYAFINSTLKQTSSLTDYKPNIDHSLAVYDAKHDPGRYTGKDNNSFS